MRQGISRLAVASRGIAALAALVALSGCGGGSYVGSLFGSGSASSPPPAQPVASGQAAPQGAPQSAVFPLFNQGPTELVCPYVDVREGAAAHRVYAGQQSNATVRYQYSMGEIARECRVAGNQLILKIGVEGRVLLGPAGSPGSFTVPVTIAVRDEATKQFVANRTYRVAASIAQGTSNTSFTAVSDEIAVPYKGLAANEAYLIYVGFDGASSAAGSQQARRRR
jgi:hypothetical protein